MLASRIGARLLGRRKKAAPAAAVLFNQFHNLVGSLPLPNYFQAPQITSIIDGLKRLYVQNLMPLEEKYHFNDFVCDFDAKPMVMLLGQYSTGKTTFIKHILQANYPGKFELKMLPQGMKKAITDNPKKLAELIDLVNLPSTLREFMGHSRSSRLGCFKHVWSYIKENNLQDPSNKNLVNCDEKLKSILLGKAQVDLVELPMLVKLHFPKQQK